MDFKDIIETQRTRLGLTLEDVARYVGVSAATVSRWESGNIKNVRRDKVAKLAEILQVSPAVLMGWDEIIEIETPDSKASVEDQRDFARDEHEEEMLLLARHMAPIPEEDRSALKKQFKSSIDLYLKALKNSPEEK